MSTILTGPLKINGVISTNKTVLQNLNSLASSSSCFLTFDINQGKWAVIINKTGSSVASFNDSNIVGSITVSETGVSELYNSASAEFPHPDIRDQKDYVDISIDAGLRYPNEVDKPLTIPYDCINDPIQAQYLAGVELKQTRLSKIVTFNADYTSLGLKAGDLIDITNSMYDFTNKVFRINKIEENDEDTIGLTITALEYDADLYDNTGLTRNERSPATGIQLREQNTAIQTSDDIDTGNQMTRLLLANAGAALLRSLFSRLAGTNTFGPATATARNLDKLLAATKAPALSSLTMTEEVCEGGTITVSISNLASVEACGLPCTAELPNLEYSYTITGVAAADVNVPLTGSITVSGTTNTGSLSIVTSATSGGATTNTLTISVGGLGDFCTIYNNPAYDYIASASSTTITEGNSTTITLDVLNVAIGTVVPYTITGSTDRITSPALTGNVTINSSSQATLTIATSVSAGYTGNDTFVVTFAPSLSSPCIENKISITVNDSTAAPPPDVTPLYILTPIVWGGVYAGDTGQLKSVTVLKSAYMPAPFAGSATINVPTALTVTQGSPSSISVSSSVAIATTATLGGTLLQPITTFNTVAPNTAITGTRASIYGYF
jgi:hypothetical protein